MAKFDFKNILRDELRELKAHAPEPGKYKVRLDANEAPDFLPAEAKKARYPSANQKTLKKAIAAATKVQPEQLLCGVGSDELISLLLTVATRPKNRAPAPTILSATPTLGMYRLSARLRGQRVMEVPLNEDWDLNLPGMLRAIEVSDPNLIFLASPNNPTGKAVSRETLETIAKAAQSALLVIDESYVAYAEEEQLSLVNKFENVVVLRSLSKIGFAGLRVGWLTGNSNLVAELEKARLPYNLSSVSQAMATFAFDELSDEIKASCQSVREARCLMTEQLLALPGVHVVPSEANFLWLELKQASSGVHEHLKRAGVLVRSFHGRGGRLEKCIRVSVGTSEENAYFIDALRDAL